MAEEDIKLTGERVVDTVKKIIDEGNVRRITVKDSAGETVLSLPLTIGVVGVAIAPVLAALGAVAGLMAECTISVERNDTPGDQS